MRHPLPYAFARSHQLLLEDDGQQLTLWHSDQPDPGAWGEVLRLHPVRQPPRSTPLSAKTWA